MATFIVNGSTVAVEKNQKLIRFLRDELHLTSVKDGCSEGACGTCHVLNGCQVQGIPQKADELLIFFHGHALPVNGEGCHVIVSFVPARRHTGA